MGIRAEDMVCCHRPAECDDLRCWWRQRWAEGRYDEEMRRINREPLEQCDPVEEES